MKKHIIIISILICVILGVGVGVWYIMRKSDNQSLHSTVGQFILDDDTKALNDKMVKAESLYKSKVDNSETRLTMLNEVIAKIDIFEKDLHSYLILSGSKSSANKLNKKYKSLSGTRDLLITNYDEYITRMQGNVNIDGSALNDLYNELFDKTIDYLYDYNACFRTTASHTFDKVYTAENIKEQLYALYSEAVVDLANNISNHKFSNITLISILNEGIVLDNGNIQLKEDVKGGEFSTQALKFKKHFNNSNISSLVKNFNTYYSLSINPATETSNEKLAVYYMKQILEI